jgi:hypothetical protein
VHTSSSLHGLALGLAAVSVLASCNTAPPAPSQSAPEAASPQAGGLRTREVAWPARGTLDRGALGALGARAAEAVRGSRVPVLLPARRELLAAAQVIAKERWTVASVRAEGATITVTASRAARVVPGVGAAQGNRDIRATRGFVSQNEGIWSAAWIENGVAYSVEVECASPDAAMCADEAFVMELANGLAYVGGAEEVAR